MHEGFLQQAIAVACDNIETGGGPFGAIIVRNNEIIASSGNCVTPNLDPTAHAEIVAIRLACQKLGNFQLSDCTLYSSCEPCPMCLGAIYWARLQAVYYACDRLDAAQAGFDDSFIYAEIDKPAQQRLIAMQQLSLDSANRPFEMWRIKTDKVRY